MANKKIPISASPDDKALEQRVDAMMDRNLETSPAPELTPAPAPAPDPIPAPPAPVPKAKPKTAISISIPEPSDEAVSEPAHKIDVSKYQPAAKITPQSAKASAPELPTAASKKIAITDHDETAAPSEPKIVLTHKPKTVAAPAHESPKKIAVTIQDDDDDEEMLAQAPVNVTAPEPAPAPIVEIPPTPEVEPEPEIEPEPTPKPAVLTVDEAVRRHKQRAAQAAATPLDDAKTDEAIADITAQESDTVLEKADEVAETPPPKKTKKEKQPRQPLGKRKKLVIGIVLLILALAAVLGVPATRYKALGLVLKNTVTVTVLDQETQQPVSAATVSIAGQEATTNSEGIAQVTAIPGPASLNVNKEYYAGETSNTNVAIVGKSKVAVSLKATGRRVPITIVNTLSGKAVANAEIKVSNTSAKTDKNGKTTLVLPTNANKQEATITLGGYNSKKVVVEVTANTIPANTFTIVPAGKVYALSNESGTIDVVKMNLDGTERKLVLKGTGKEDQATTVLLASRDWKYVALKAQRDKAQASMFMINTSTDKVIEFDSGDSSFTPIGWYGNHFMYDVVRNTVLRSQNSHEVIKSYDAERGQLNQLDQTQAEDKGNGGYVYQGFYNFYLLDGLLMYNAQWYSSSGASLAGKTSAIRGVQPNGQGKKDYQTLDATGLAYIQAVLNKPQEIYYGAYNYEDNKTVFLEYKNEATKISSDLDQSAFNKTYPTYLYSPSGKSVFWSEMRNGRSMTFIGDANAGNARQLTNLVGYTAYGWFSDNYLLASKNDSELYIVTVDGSKPPVKIGDYFKPERGVPSYAYGYGGL